MVEMYIGDKRYMYRFLDRGQRLGGLTVGDGYAYDLTAASFELFYLANGRFGVAGIRLCHGLDDYGCAASYDNVAYIYRFGFALAYHLKKPSPLMIL
jgi:hypothetical protein